LDLGDGILRHPTALYEILFLGVLWWIIRRWESKRPFQEGFRFQLFLASYLLYRFCIAFIQPGYRVPFLQLTSLQIACLLGLVYYIQIWLRFRTFKNPSIKSP
jgi:phosphatidylglycerol:prolipoprotein diacylglycerol transferase